MYFNSQLVTSDKYDNLLKTKLEQEDSMFCSSKDVALATVLKVTC